MPENYPWDLDGPANEFIILVSSPRLSLMRRDLFRLLSCEQRIKTRLYYSYNIT